MAKLDLKYYSYDRLTKINPLTEYDDIEEGALYHIPPIMVYDRRDFIVIQKTPSTLVGKMRFEDGVWKETTLYKSELSTRYLIKRKSLRNDKG